MQQVCIILQLYGVFQPLYTFVMRLSRRDESTNLMSGSSETFGSSDKPTTHSTCRAPDSRQTRLMTSWWGKYHNQEIKPRLTEEIRFVTVSVDVAFPDLSGRVERSQVMRLGYIHNEERLRSNMMCILLL